MNKTAMMQLRDRLQAKESSCTNYDAIQVYKSLINLIDTELLEIEKQQMIDFGNKMQLITDIDCDGNVIFAFQSEILFKNL
jgi:hypothetical protein